MAQVMESWDFTPLKAVGFQVLKGVLPEFVREDLRRRAQQVIEERQAGRLTTFDQDTQGFPYEWYVPLQRNPVILDVATSLFGPDVCSAGWRVLAKDKHFKKAIHVHQDWPYNDGDTRKLTVFVPLTPISAANGGLYFLERSHLYGPVSRGAIDLSRFPPLTHTCPELQVGDLLICDFLTWHYSKSLENDDERIMVQLNYQPASDSSGKTIVAGALPHELHLPTRFDAVSVPSVELNCAEARACFEAGNLDRATRFARGLVADDPDHAGAALLLFEILSAEGDPSALKYLEMARTALNKLQGAFVAHAVRFGLDMPSTLHDPVAPVQAVESSPWRSLELSWKSHIKEQPVEPTLPATLFTPEQAWDYGATTGLLETDKPATLRVRAKALKGKIGVCLLSGDYRNLMSEPQWITPELGDATLMIEFTPEQSPARLLVRNHEDPGVAGEVALKSVDILRIAEAAG